MLNIITYPDPVLREKSEDYDTFDDSLKTFAQDMIDTMYLDDGVGLAANQVGVAKRLIVLDPGQGPMALVNPRIVETGDEEEIIEEGCLSLPDIRINIERPMTVKVEAQTLEGEAVTLDADGWLARILQHEIDHLNGVLIIDHASTVQRTMLRSKLKKLEKNAG